MTLDFSQRVSTEGRDLQPDILHLGAEGNAYISFDRIQIQCSYTGVNGIDSHYWETILK